MDGDPIYVHLKKNQKSGLTDAILNVSGKHDLPDALGSTKVALRRKFTAVGSYAAAQEE